MRPEEQTVLSYFAIVTEFIRAKDDVTAEFSGVASEKRCSTLIFCDVVCT